jgi:uncharacterized membrane protein
MSVTSNVTSDITGRSTRSAIEPAGTIRYGYEIPLLLVAAFSLSVVHTVYAWAAGLEDPEFNLTTPLAWGFYAVGFGMAALARKDAIPAQVTLLGLLVTVLGLGVFYYPTTFTEAQQTTFGWFENDLYIGLLLISLYLSVMRLRRRALVP